MKPFPILSSEIILDTPYYKVEKQCVKFPDGTIGDWYIKRNANAVIVIPMNRRGEILLQKTYKHGSGTIVTEFCAGLIDNGEKPVESAARELQEETGYISSNLEKIGEMFASPTSTDMKYYFFVAHDCTLSEGNNLESAEQIEPFWVKNTQEAEKILLKAQPQVSASTLSAWMLFRSYQQQYQSAECCSGNGYL
jgi:ADP-ribose pyrophosphatase